MRADRIIVSVIAVLILAAPVLITDPSDGDSPAPVPYGATEYTITFDTNSGSQALMEVTSMTTTDQKLSELPTPVWKNHTFKGWYIERPGSSERVGEDKVYTEDTTLTAHWTEPEDRYNTGGAIDFTNRSTVIMVAFLIVALVLCVLAALIAFNRRKFR